MSFTDDIKRIVAKTNRNLAAIRQGVDDEVLRSIVDGSEITGAPGQPIGTGELHDSWQQAIVDASTTTFSDVPYATAVEENWGNVTYENGGPHSVALTAAGFGRIVEDVARDVTQ